jgi:hypothetical protein
MWKPRRLTTVWASTACYRDSFALTYKMMMFREEHRLRVFENRVLRRIFGPKRDEMTGGWRKLHSEELHKFTFRHE